MEDQGRAGRRDSPNYGIDAPGFLIGYAVAGAVALAVGVSLDLVDLAGGAAAVWIGSILLAAAAVHLWSSRVGKLRETRRMVDAIEWRGTEHVLDVGCGRGLVLIEAAKRVPAGSAVGVDIWNEKDQSGNRPGATLGNAALEGVDDRIEVKDGDACDLPFPDETFDVVLSSAVLHNIHEREGRRRALREIVRVLRPGGRIAIMDIVRTPEYARELRALGMTAVARTEPRMLWLLPVRVVLATKPA